MVEVRANTGHTSSRRCKAKYLTENSDYDRYGHFLPACRLINSCNFPVASPPLSLSHLPGWQRLTRGTPLGQSLDARLSTCARTLGVFGGRLMSGCLYLMS